jgi:hypothetical protein
MLKRPVAFMTRRALPVAFIAQIYRVLKLTVLSHDSFSTESLVERCMTDIALVSDD